jgi:serine/threonine-protein kinase mTOR
MSCVKRGERGKHASLTIEQAVSNRALRLQGCQPDVEVWQRILQVRALVLRSEEEPTMWIKFANLCRKNDRMWLAEKTINSLTQPSHAVGLNLL